MNCDRFPSSVIYYFAISDEGHTILCLLRSISHGFCHLKSLVYVEVVLLRQHENKKYQLVKLWCQILITTTLCDLGAGISTSWHNCWYCYTRWHPLLWRHNGHSSISNHQPHDCLHNRLFRRRSKKTSKLRVTGLCVGNSPGPVNSPHKGPVTRKMFPFDDVIMCDLSVARPCITWLQISAFRQKGEIGFFT